MALPSSRLSGLVEKAGTHADDIEKTGARATAKGTERGAAAANEPGGAMDVWSHTAAGAEAASQERPADAWKAAADSPSREWARADSDAMGTSMAAQAADAKKQFEILTGQREPDPGKAGPQGAMGHLGATFDLLTSLEQIISAPLAMLPFPAFPALRVMDMDIGLPHGHTHPPNLVPPAPMVFLPSTGPIIPIPFLSGATRTLINGLPAGRCGDMGLGVWCGGYFPMYEVFLGSSSVWIEGARAGRLLVDVTRHCMFTVPKPTDPPLGPMVGMTITASPNVLVGGVPMPSLLDLAMGAAMEALFKGIAKAAKKAKELRAQRLADEVPAPVNRSSDLPTHPGVDGFDAKRLDDAQMFRRLVHSPFVEGTSAIDRMRHAKSLLDDSAIAVNKMVHDGKIAIRTQDPHLKQKILDDLYYIHANPEGRKTLDRIAKADGVATTIEPVPNGRGMAWPDPQNKNPGAHYYDVDGGKPGNGTDTWVQYDPNKAEGPDCPPDTTLFHELEHAANNAEGVNRSKSIHKTPSGMTYTKKGLPPPASPGEMPGASQLERQDFATSRYTDMEEYRTVQKENRYRALYNQKPRWGHFNMSLKPGS
ncbi:MAG: hypothetical protein HKO98_09215 [Gemmatimonadetes bacterium]|nr:hypothetical protein [Gemmatimonadota bacterium]